MASLISALVGHERIIQNWLRAQENQRLAGVYLFVGPSGVGKKTAAWALAQAYLCRVTPTGCGECASCLKVEKRQSENVHFVEPSGQMIKMEQAQEVLRYLSLKSWSGKRVVIIDQIQAVHPSAGNALLKTLEEPPEETQFFLIAPSASSVLPTLRSRCQVFSFYPVAPEDMRKKVQAPEWMLRASRGSFEKLAQFQEESSLPVRREAAELWERCVLKPDFITDDSWRDTLKEKGLWPRLIMYWNYLIRDAIYIQCKKKEQILNTDLLPFLEKLAAQPMNQLLFWQETLMKWENELLIHRDSQLQMETLFISNQAMKTPPNPRRS